MRIQKLDDRKRSTINCENTVVHTGLQDYMNKKLRELHLYLSKKFSNYKCFQLQVTNVSNYKIQMFQITNFANCKFFKLHILQIKNFAN